MKVPLDKSLLAIILKKGSLVTYTSWFKEHARKHKIIIDKLVAKNYTKEQIIEYFDFDNMVAEENNFCLLYKDNEKCHDMEKLNCYLCACPNFRFDDKGIKKVGKNTQFSFCDINHKDGSQDVYSTRIHQNCSKCDVPHKLSYIKKHFDLDWSKAMKQCIL